MLQSIGRERNKDDDKSDVDGEDEEDHLIRSGWMDRANHDAFFSFIYTPSLFFSRITWRATVFTSYPTLPSPSFPPPPPPRLQSPPPSPPPGRPPPGPQAVGRAPARGLGAISPDESQKEVVDAGSRPRSETRAARHWTSHAGQERHPTTTREFERGGRRLWGV